MALILSSDELYERLDALSANEIRHAYNALDASVTMTVWERLKPLVEASPHATLSYAFVRAMQGPAMDMMRRGIAINAKVRADETERYLNIRQRAQAILDCLADAVWGSETYVETTRTTETYTPVGKRGQPLNPRTRVVRTEVVKQRPRGLNANSTPQCLAFFNTALNLPPQWAIRKTAHGTERTPSADDKALRKWSELRMKGPGVNPRDKTVYPVKLAAPFISLILTIRSADKMLSVLRTPLDDDGRMRCSYNVVGTESGRWSSSKNANGRGSNLQNIEPTMRRMFCADDGHTFVSTDLEQAESRVVAGLVWATTGDSTYWTACESNDLHTQVCRMTWPELEWSDDEKANRKIAEQTCPDIPTYTYRDVAKRLGHGSNYRGSPYGIAQAVGIPAHIVEGFQARYFRAFAAIPEWHGWAKAQLNNHQFMDTPIGRRRWFFGRPSEDSTLREAIAFSPQSTVGELLNLIMLHVWQRSILPQSHPAYLPIQLLLQNHDAFAFQVPHAANLQSVIAAVNSEFVNTTIPFVRGDEVRHMSIPGEFVTGWNWAYEDPSRQHFADGNPDGLRKWRGEEPRTRTQSARAVPADWLKRQLRSDW